MITLHRSLRHVAKLASQNSIMYALSGVLVEQVRNRARVTATDGKRLIEVTAPTIKAEDLPPIEGFNAGANGARQQLVEADTYSSVFSTLKASTMPCRENVSVTLEKDKATFATTDLSTNRVTPVKPLDAKFPDVAAVIPLDEPVHTAIFDARLLGETLRVVADILKDAGLETPGKKHGRGEPAAVRIDFFGEGKAAVISAGNPEAPCGQITALVMPISSDKAPKRWRRKR